MCKSKIYLFFALLALNQFSSWAGSMEKLCKIETRLSEIQMEKENHKKSTKALKTTLQKLISQDIYDRMVKIENRQKSMEVQHKMIHNNREIQQTGIQKMMNIQLESIKELISQDIGQRLDKIEAQVSAAQMDILFQLTNIWRTLSKIEARQRFKAIGLKFYYIEDNLKQNWTVAAQSCRQMGGNLASIQNNEEFLAIKGKINPDFVYWLDINDHNKKGDFMSVASGESVTFFRWLPGEPRYDDESQRYVNLFNGGMRVENGSKKRNFICQYDDQD